MKLLWLNRKPDFVVPFAEFARPKLLYALLLRDINDAPFAVLKANISTRLVLLLFQVSVEAVL